jgi:VWFA-related protein
MINLIALDKDGRPVTDLKSGELRLFDGEAEQKIKALSPAVQEPLFIGLLFDVSGSRQHDTYAAEETRLTSEFLHSIWREGDGGFVLAFNYEVYPLAQPSQELAEVDLGLRKVSGSPYRGATALNDALCSVKPEKLAAILGRKVYLVFSDFEDNASRNRAEQVLKVAHEGGIAIFPVILSQGFGGGQSKSEEKRSWERAQQLADETGGEVLIPKSPMELAHSLQRFAADLQSVYRVSYEPSPAASQKKSKKAKIRIETTRERVTLIYPKSSL